MWSGNMIPTDYHPALTFCVDNDKGIGNIVSSSSKEWLISSGTASAHEITWHTGMELT